MSDRDLSILAAALIFLVLWILTYWRRRKPMTDETNQIHEMQLLNTHENGYQDWFCPICQRRFLLGPPPEFKKITLEHGEGPALHTFDWKFMPQEPQEPQKPGKPGLAPAYSPRDVVRSLIAELDRDGWKVEP